MQNDKLSHLLNDETFLNYCFRRNETDTIYWENWLKENKQHEVQIRALKVVLISTASETAQIEVNAQIDILRNKISSRNSTYSWYKARYVQWAAVAALLLVALSFSTYFLLGNKTEQQLDLTSRLRPGGDKAVLTLANGKTIILTGADNGFLANEANSIVSKSKDGLISYEVASNPVKVSNVTNVITTPRGGQYTIVLADGTRVKLNASSSLKYPVAFNSETREVELSGEAYFEVAHNARKPFLVISNGQSVKVLGTHFNINAYPDENAVETTLLQGSVRIKVGSAESLLMPGEQAQTSLNGHSGITISKVDTAMAVAWKNGFFSFKRAGLQTVMREVSRWYDVQVNFEGKIPATAITGKLHRNANASQVFEILNDLGVPFKIEGRTVTILQK